MRPCRGRCPSDGLCGLLSGWLVEASFSPDGKEDGKEIVFRLETGTGYALAFIDRDGRQDPHPCRQREAAISSTVEPRVEANRRDGLCSGWRRMSAVPLNTDLRQQQGWCCVSAPVGRQPGPLERLLAHREEAPCSFPHPAR